MPPRPSRSGAAGQGRARIISPTEEIPFCDLRAAHSGRASSTEAALRRVARSGRYILGPELEEFEREFAACCGAAHAVGVGSGTDAIALSLRAAGIGSGDEVVVPAYTAAATWMAVVLAGAVPVGADVEPATGLLNPHAAEAAIGPRTRAVIAVHLFGRLAPMRELKEITTQHDLLLVEDAAHAAGVDEGSGRAGSLGDAAAFSFYPTKTLGGLGDGGALVTDDRTLADAVRRLRSYGWSRWQGDAQLPGVNSRLDEIQAAVLRERLRELPQAHLTLRGMAQRYRSVLEPLAPALNLIPAAVTGEPPWHQFVITTPRRERLRGALAERGIGTAVHYDPIPPQLTAFGAQGRRFPCAQALAQTALSLPFDPWMTEVQTAAVCSGVAETMGSIERSLT